MNYYAISDIHGLLDELEEAMKLIDLGNNDNKLILLGDYIDYGDKSCEVLYYIKNLNEKYKSQVIVLMGNHEEMFLEWLLHPKEYVNYFIEDRDLHTLKTFLNNDEIDKFIHSNDVIKDSTQIANLINDKHKDLIKWLHKLPYYYETENQIFVHAGIDEEAEELWKIGTPKEYFTNKFPATKGRFIKDIIAGHIGTTNFRKDKNNNEIYWDGASHYYIDGIDGNENKNKNIPILKYNTKTKTYTCIQKIKNEWREYRTS